MKVLANAIQSLELITEIVSTEKAEHVTPINFHRPHSSLGTTFSESEAHQSAVSYAHHAETLGELTDPTSLWGWPELPHKKLFGQGMKGHVLDCRFARKEFFSCLDQGQQK